MCWGGAPYGFTWERGWMECGSSVGSDFWSVDESLVERWVRRPLSSWHWHSLCKDYNFVVA